MDADGVLREAVQPALLAEVKGKEGKLWDVVIIRPGMSKNGNFYASDVLRTAVPLFEGIKAYAYRFGAPLGDKFNHLPDQIMLNKPDGLSQNEVGWFEDVRYGTFTDRDGTKGEGILAKFHVLEGHDWLRKNLRDAYSNGRSDILGFSIDARGRGRDGMVDGKRVKMVEKIDEVRSTDVVTEPAAGGGVLRLVAGPIGQGSPTMDEFLKLIREARPMWFDGFAPPTDDTDLTTYALDMLESVQVQAEEVQRDIPIEQTKALAEAARGVNTLNMLISLIREGKMDEAMKMIRNWIAVYPVEARGTAQSRTRGFYSFPYAKSPSAAAAPAVAREGVPEGAAGGEGGDPPAEGAPAEGNPPAEGDAPPAAEGGDGGDAPPKEEGAEAEGQAEGQEAKENAMDADTKAKLERLEELEKKNAELAKRERDLGIKEKVKESGLPEKAQERLVSELTTREGEVSAEDIDVAVTKEREYIASLSVQESGKPHDLGGAHGDDKPDVKVTQDQQEKYAKAFDGLFASGHPQDGVPAFHSLHEAFGLITGKYHDRETMADLIFESIALAVPNRPRADGIGAHLSLLREGWGNRDALPCSRRLLEQVGTGDWSVAFGDALFRRLQKVYAEDPRNDWRDIVSSIENITDLNNDFNIIRLGGFDELPVVNEKAPYQELTPEPTEVTEQLSSSKRGGLFKLTWEDILADRIGVIRQIPNKLGRSAVLTIHQLVWDEIENNPTIQGNALISAANSNLVTGNPALSYDDMVTAIQQLRDQTEQDSLKKLGLRPEFLLVSPEKESEAIEITDSTVKASTSEDATIRSFVNRLGVKTFSTLGIGRTAGTSFRWYVAASPRDAETIVVGFLGGRDRPDIFVQSPMDTPTAGAAFLSDALTFKIRLGVGAKVADWRWIQGSLATA